MNQQQVQQCIRQDAEERNEALSDLTAWMETLKVDKPESIPSNYEEEHARGDAAVKSAGYVAASEGTYEEEHKRGNTAFRKGEYAEAVECYCRCLIHDEALSTPNFYSNLSLAYLKMKHWSKAEHAATSALHISPCHSKSLHRRSVANKQQGKLRAALVDVCVACHVVTGGQKEEIAALKYKIEHALIDATNKAPRRRVTISFV
jgi:tetratricopeptide (TPR) repeat protein